MSDTQDFEEMQAAKNALLALTMSGSGMTAVRAALAFIDEADDLGSDGAGAVLETLNALKDRRSFELLYITAIMAERFSLSSLESRQLEVQALIELGRTGEAASRALQLEAETRANENEVANPENFKIWAKAKGNLGRTFKQRFMNASRRQMMARKTGGKVPAPDAAMLRRAITYYEDVWKRNPNSDTTYHAINAIALLMRARREEQRTRNAALAEAQIAAAHDETYEQTAERHTAIQKDLSSSYFWLRSIAKIREFAMEVLNTLYGEFSDAAIDEKPLALWEAATAAEACLALSELADDDSEEQALHRDQSRRLYRMYAEQPENSAFQIASSLRQLEEVWEISGQDSTRGAIIRDLKMALIGRNIGADADSTNTGGSGVSLAPGEVQLMLKDLPPEIEEEAGTEAFTSASGITPPTSTPPENKRVFTGRLLRKAFESTLSVCSIEAHHEGRPKFVGTGFAADGGIFNPDWKGQPVIVTNHHVVAIQRNKLNTHHWQATARFTEIQENGCQFRDVILDSVLWHSDEFNHDITILRPQDGVLPNFVKPIRHAMSKLPPRSETKDGLDFHLYMTGHPRGEDVSVALEDTRLLDHDALEQFDILPENLEKALEGRAVTLHYRTPSSPGNSGSPLFETSGWRLIGMHRGGKAAMERMHPKSGHYSANFGVWLPSIVYAIARDKQTLDENGRQSSDESFFDSQSRFGGMTNGFGGGGFGRGGNVPPPISSDLPGADERSEPFQTAPPAPSPTVPSTPSHPPNRKPQYPRIIHGFRGDIPPTDTSLTSYLKYGKERRENLNNYRLGGMGLQSVIGSDDRVQVTETWAYPWRMICSLRIVWNEAGRLMSVGTGFFIGPNTVLTAAHCLYNRRFGLPEYIEIVPALNGAQKPFESVFGPSISARRFSVHQRFQHSADPAFDVGAIHLDVDAGQKLGWFRIESRQKADLDLHWAHITGYPADKETLVHEAEGTRSARGMEMFHHATPIDTVHESGRIHYPADTFGGQSGAPIFVMGEDNLPTVVGVHAYGDSRSETQMPNNSGPWIDPAMFQQIMDWRNVP